MKFIMHKTVFRLRNKLNMFGSVLAGCGLLLLLPGAQAQYTWTWPVYEPFSEYTDTPMKLGGGTSSNYWNFGNGGTNGVTTYIVTNTAAMSYPALLADPNPIPNGVQEVPTSTTSADRGACFPTNSGTFYTSFLLNYQDSGSAVYDRLVYNLVTGAPTNYPNAGSFTKAYTAVWLTPDYRIKVTKNFNSSNTIATANFSAPTPLLATNIPHLIVMRYLKVTGGIDEVDLWVDPTPFGDDARIPPPTISTTNAPNVPFFNGVVLNNRKLNGQASYQMNTFLIDEIRLADTWSGVTPLATPAPGPMFSVTGGGIGARATRFPLF